MQKGFIATLSILTLLAFSLSLSIAVTYLSIGESHEALALSQGRAALDLTEGCVEDALLMARNDENYSGGTREYLGGTCVVGVSKDGTTWTFSVEGVKDTFSRTIEVVVEYTAPAPATLVLTSWLEQ